MNYDKIIGKIVNLPTHFPEPVHIDGIKKINSGNYKIRVRRQKGSLEEIILSEEEITQIQSNFTIERQKPIDAQKLSLLVETYRIRDAYAFDPFFAVSLSGIQTLPHQIEAVYGKMLPQPRLRFLLADDPGAGKTIMAGLLIKEMKLRTAIEKILILVPASLTIQWQDELLRFFNEYFVVVNYQLDRAQTINIWQKESQIITSIDYAKQENVRERIWQQKWDIVIVDEAHKCSAYTKRRSDRAPEAFPTKRYKLVDELSKNVPHLLFLTATPHHGDDDRFAHFLRLLDPDIFPEPHKFPDRAREIRKTIFKPGANNFWILRRLKEDLKDLNGRRLFTDRHSITITFRLNREEYALYEAVTDYLNDFLIIKGRGRYRQAIALTRTVFQRRLASSTRAIYESLKRRIKKQKEFLEELESLPVEERIKRLENIRGRLPDEELDEGDLTEEDKDRLTDEFIIAQEIDQLKEEIAALQDLVIQAEKVYKQAPDSKLKALKNCLERAEFSELRDGRGKLLIFTEHRDTLQHLKEHLQKWDYTTCEIHGGMDPHLRKAVQEEFRTKAQICIATEAAGEGINLQFCHLVINYDLPWNPTRLEQRLGRIHRIGQKRDVYAFNFVAEEAENGKTIVEGKVLRRLLEKLEKMRKALGSDRVYDVIGQILSLNKVDLAEILREAAYNPHRLEEYLDKIEKIDPKKLEEYEKITGIALARGYVNFEQFQKANFLVEEKRLMPEYIERFFLKASEIVGLKVGKRVDGLYKIPYVPSNFRSETLNAVKKFGKPDSEYKKITFHKEDLEKDIHFDAVLISPGHPLYGVVEEKLIEKLKQLYAKQAVFLDVNATIPYWIHYFEISIIGEPEDSLIYKELVAVKEENGKYSLLPADILHDLSPYPKELKELPFADMESAKDYSMSTCQLQKRNQILKQREEQSQIIKEYLAQSFDKRIYSIESKIMDLKARELEGEDVRLSIQNFEKELEGLKRQKEEKIKRVSSMAIVRPGPIALIASFWVLPPQDVPSVSQFLEDKEEKEKSEIAAMKIVMEYERNRGWEPEDVSSQKIGFDIRSLSPADPQTGYRQVRRIEVKGRKKGQPIRLTENEWRKAKNLKDTYWLYVVWEPLGSNYEIITIPDPANKLEFAVREIRTISHYEISADAIERIKNYG